MELDLRFEKEPSLVRVRIVGSVDIDQILEILPSFLEHEEFVPGMPVLFDLTEASMADTSVSQMRQAGAEQRQVADRRGQARVAAVTESDLDFGILRMYEAHAHGQTPHLEFRVFRNMDKAERWVLSQSDIDAT